ncbi:MAG: tetratricopeptide repeat protein [Lacipirellulaceae bacterium]
MHLESQPEYARHDLEQQTLDLYESGQYNSAYQNLRESGGLDALQGSAGRALAGRLANVLGAPRYGASIHLRAWRQSPDAETLGFYVALEYARKYGPVQALKFLESIETEALSPKAFSDVASAKVYMLAALRDFEPAEDALSRAFDAVPARPWLYITKGTLLQCQDRPEEALEAYEQALQERPYYRPGVQSLAGQMVQLNRVDEARALLIDACDRLQCGLLHIQLAQLERELSMYELARGRLEAAMPLLLLYDRDRDSKKNYLGLAAMLAYDVGDLDESIRLSKEVDTKFHKTVVENLEQHRSTGRRVVLDVGFTLQHDVTCVPATLSTLCQFWNQPVEHLEIAEEICYDGTPAHAEREWLEEHGFFCREFTLDWDTSLALIDAGLPFTQTLTGYTMGHMQAVIGYDSRSGVLIYRDPNVRHSGEVLGKELLEHLRSTGPRGMVFVPEAQRSKVDALDLPDHQLWTLSHRISVALNAHRRDDAVKIYKELEEIEPDHRITTHSRARIAAYDGDLRKLDKLTDRLLEEFPKDQYQWSVKLSILRQLATRADRLKVLEELCDQPDCEMVYRHQLLDELLGIPNEREHVDYLLKRCMRANSIDAQTFTLLARQNWITGNRDESLGWYRYAACLETRADNRSMTYFHASCALNRSDEAIKMLRDRFQRFKTRDSGPARSLVEALDHLFKTKEALEVLREAVKARPDDGELRLFACQFLMRLGKLEKAQEQLESAKSKCHEADWLATAAQLAQQRGRLGQAYKYLDKSLQKSPLNVQTHRRTAEVLADWRGADVAAKHLTKYVKRFPRNSELRALLVEISSEIGVESAIEAAQAHLKLHPEDAWCWRELGYKYVEQRKWSEASLAAKEAEKNDPQAQELQLLKSMIAKGQGDDVRAREHCVKALRISVDYLAAMQELVRLCDSQEERQQLAKVILEEMKQQVIYGETLHTFRHFAARAFEADKALEIVKEAQAARPDLWQSSSAVVAQLVAMKRIEEAIKEAKSNAKKFPLLPVVWIDLANVYLASGNLRKEIEALGKALAINSRNGETLRNLAEAYRRAGKIDKEEQFLRRACESEPRDVTHRGALADCYWREGKRDVALDTIRKAIEQEPGYEWGWERLEDWSYVINEPDQLVEMTQTNVDARPESLIAWLQRAEILERFPEKSQERWNSIEQALKIDPRSTSAYEHQARFLATHGRFDEALAACEPEVFSDRQPLQLQSRAAIIEYQRGDRDAAIKRMRQVVKTDPHYAFAWSQLATWNQEIGDLDEALKCAKQLTQIAPYAPASWGYVAECLINSEKLDEAKKHLKRAVDLDSSYLYGGHTLIRLHVDEGRFDEALKMLGVISPHLTEYETAATESRLHALANREREAINALRSACQASAETNDHLMAAVDQLLMQGWAVQVKEVLRDTINQQLASPQAVSTLVEVLAREAKLSEIEALCESLDDTSVHWLEAVAAYLEVLGDAQTVDRINAFVAPKQQKIREHTNSWALVGSALQQSGQWQAAVDWMADWNARNDAQTHQLGPLALSLLSLGQAQEAIEVVNRTLSLPLANATDTLRVLGASAEVLLGNQESTARRLASVTPQYLSPFYASLYAMLRAASHGAVEVSRGSKWKDAWKDWQETEKQHSQTSNEELFETIRLHSRLLLIRQSGNAIRTWMATRACRKASVRLAEKAKSIRS